MKLQDLVLQMDKTNDFINQIGGKKYEFVSDITGVCKNYREFIRATRKEFVDQLAVINAEVTALGEGKFEAFYPFDNKVLSLEFDIRLSQ